MCETSTMDRQARRTLTALAAAQHGQVNVWQAADIGITHDHLRRAVRAGELQRVRPAVYRFAAVPVDWRTELHADTLSAPKGAFAAQSAALRLHRIEHPLLPYRRELLKLGTGLVHVEDAVVVHRTRRLDPQDVREVNGIPATSLARTLVDLCRGLAWWDLVDVADRAICEWPSARATVHRTAVRLRRGRHGVQQLADVTAPNAEAVFRSWLERQAAPLVRRAGITDARWNVTIPGLVGAGLVDTHSSAHGLVVEWKGLAFHRRPHQLQRDSDKQNVAASRGLVTFSFTWQDVVSRPEHVIGVLVTATRRRAA
jgi:hypothetical protein